MPSAMTHAYFADDVYRKLPSRVKQKIERDTMRVFTQGPDMFYYHFFSSKVRSFGKEMHSHKTKRFFETYIEYMKRYRLEKKKEAISAFYGFLLHYILDMKTHPLIFYQTGSNTKNKVESKNSHREMELLLDLYYMEKKEKKNPAIIRHDRYLFPTRTFSSSLEHLLDDTIMKTYRKEDMGKCYLKSMRKMRFIHRFLSYDPHGRKLKFYRICDRLKLHRGKKWQYLSYANDLRRKATYFNCEHNRWCYPVDASIEKTESFFELYEEAIEEAVMWISKFHDVFVGKEDVKECMKDFPSNSYLTGVSEFKKTKMKYFKK